MNGIRSEWLYKNKYMKPPINAIVAANRIVNFIPKKLRNRPASTNAVRSEQAKYTEFAKMLPGKYFI
jgi:hypothetical protein